MLAGENLDPFFSLEEFAVEVTSATGDSVSLIFDAPYADDIEIAGTQPQLLGPSTAVATWAPGDQITVAGRSFEVVRIEPDGTGLSRVVLKE